MISLKKLLYKMVEAINANHLPAATTADEGMVLGIKNDGTYGLIPQSGDGGGGWETIVLTGTIASVSRRSASSKSYTSTELASLGINNISDWTVVSVKQSDPRGGERYGAMYGTDLGGMATYGNSYPLVSISNGGLNLGVLNPREETSGSDDIDYEIVLARKAGSTAHNFKVLNFTISDVPADGEKTYTFTDAALAEQGISDMLNYEVLSISVKEVGVNSRYYNAHHTRYSGMFVSPSVSYSRTGQEGVTQGFQISVGNLYTAVKSFEVRLVLLRVA